MHTKFDDIRPYTDAEIPAAMSRIADNEHAALIAKFLFPNRDWKDVQKAIRNYTCIQDYQVDAMLPFNRHVLSHSVKDFTYSGLNLLDPKKSYLFISNHRDIVLDPLLLQSALYNEGFRTTEISIGSNLMSSQLVIDFVRSCKMYKIMRGENPRDFYKTSLHLSEYIRHTITQRSESIWIAQRNSRTKDGNDATAQGILKMFNMSGGKDVVQAFCDLNVVPVAISYQWEPCDILKTRELYLSRNGVKYTKTKYEDFISLLSGITHPKGNIHISVCEPLCQEELQLAANQKSSNDFYKGVANLIDKRIYYNYKLHDTNYIAHDFRSGTNVYTSHYSSQAKENFIQRYHQALDLIDGDKDTIAGLFLGIYANSIDNSYKYL